MPAIEHVQVGQMDPMRFESVLSAEDYRSLVELIEAGSAQRRLAQIRLQHSRSRARGRASRGRVGCRQVEADDQAMRSDLDRKPAEHLAGAASGIKNAHPGLEIEAPDHLAKLGLGE